MRANRTAPPHRPGDRAVPRVLGSVLAAIGVACAPAAQNAPSPAAPIAAASEPASPTTAAPAPVTSATELLAKERAPFDACYARARAARPELGRTTLEITFTLDDAGKPMTVDLQYKNRMDEDAKACLRNAALALQFPESLRGKQTGTITFTPAR